MKGDLEIAKNVGKNIEEKSIGCDGARMVVGGLPIYKSLKR